MLKDIKDLSINVDKLSLEARFQANKAVAEHPQAMKETARKLEHLYPAPGRCRMKMIAFLEGEAYERLCKESGILDWRTAEALLADRLELDEKSGELIPREQGMGVRGLKTAHQFAAELLGHPYLPEPI